MHNLKVIEAATTSCLKRRLYNVLSNVTYCPTHLQAGVPMTNIQSTRIIHYIETLVGKKK
jgi:hypothetical protein